MEYMIEVYMDGSKSENGVGSRIAIFNDKHLTFQLKYVPCQRDAPTIRPRNLQSLKRWRKGRIYTTYRGINNA